MADNDVVVDTGNEGGSGDEIADDPVTSRAMGAFLGLCIGDAAGRPLEHIGRCPTAEEARVCTTLDGVADGVVQITDDSELAICLAEGLIEVSGGLVGILRCLSHLLPTHRCAKHRERCRTTMEPRWSTLIPV